MNDKTSLVIIQSTSFCNIDCSYCYLPDRSLKKKFDIDLLPYLLKNLSDSNLIGQNLSICWHAGEPLVLPVSYYEKAVKLTEQYNHANCEILHHFQTNATLITQEYCDFFKTNNVKIGVSIDGPEYIHNIHRKTRSKKGTFSATMRGIELLKKNNIDFSVIAVLTSDSLDYPNEIFNFFEDLAPISVGLNVDEKEGVNIHSTLDSEEYQKKYIDFFTVIYELVKKGTKVDYREITHLRNVILFGKDEIINTQTTPLSILSIDTQGNFSTFSPELLGFSNEDYNNFIFGNIKDNLIIDIFKNANFIKTYNQIGSGIEKCKQECDYFSICGGGAPSNKLSENGTFASTETKYCIYSQKLLADIFLDKIEDEFQITN